MKVILSMNITDGEISILANQLKLETEKCDSLLDLLDLSYSFRHSNTTIKPHQNKEELFILLGLLDFLKPKRVMEIGTSEGGTLFLLSKIVDSDGLIISLDLPNGEGGGEFYPQWKEKFYKTFASKNQQLFLLRENSHEKSTFEKISKIIGKEKLDFLLIDGDHSYEGVKDDFSQYLTLVKKDGLIAFHDINEGIDEKVQVKKFWNQIKLDNFSAEIIDEFDDIGYGIGIMVNSSLDDPSQYAKILKKLLELQKQSYERFRDNPVSALLWLYNQRIGLQHNFPEVKNGDYKNLISWVVKTCERDSGEEKTKLRLGKFYDWYKKYDNI